MSEQSLDNPSPAIGEQSSQSSGWLTIDSSVPREDPLTVRQKEEQAKIQRRQDLIMPFLDNFLPQHPIEYYYNFYAQTSNKSVDQLDEDDKKNVSYAFENFIRSKKHLSYEIARTNIADNDLEKYTSTIFEITQNLTLKDQDINPSNLSRIVSPLETLELASYFNNLSKEWKEKFLENAEGEDFRERAGRFIGILADLTQYNISPRLAARSQEEMNSLFGSYIDLFEYFYSLPQEKKEDRAIREGISRAESLGGRANDSDKVKTILQIVKQIDNYPDREIAAKFIDAVLSFARIHELPREDINGLINKLLPAMQNGQIDAEILIKGGNIWGMREGDFGIGDFLVQSYITKISSENINELLQISREIPNSNLANLEQNRRDALSLSGSFGILRDFVHDQRPHVHEVLEAMVEYYDTGNREKLSKILPLTDYFNSLDRINAMFDIDNYEMLTNERLIDGSGGVKQKSIDFVRRLAENSKPVSNLPPESSDSILNQKLAEVFSDKSKHVLTKEKVGETMEYVNNILLNLMKNKDLGIDPNTIFAISWLERMGFESMQELNFEDQQTAFKKDWFIQMLKFQQLTVSKGNFNHEEFDQFVNILKSIDSPRQAYAMIGQRIGRQLDDLGRNYRIKGREDVGFLWSGNLTHELIGLTDLRPAISEQGRKQREEEIIRIHNPYYHPGD